MKKVEFEKILKYKTQKIISDHLAETNCNCEYHKNNRMKKKSSYQQLKESYDKLYNAYIKLQKRAYNAGIGLDKDDIITEILIRR